MKKHTKEFKSSISTFGRELDSKITVLGTELILEKEDLFSITPITNSTLLKTIMKEVDFESKKQIGVGQEVNVKSGVKVNNEYEYIDYGNYSVYKSQYKAETDTYSHICYDKMLKTMIDYTPLDITYPINLREYITAIATKCGLEFADKNNTFANYNTSINEDHFSNGNYTFRDVLDYIAQLVGGWFCINNDDKLEIRYPELAKNYGEANGEDVSFTSNVEDEINTIIVDGKSTQETRSGKNIFNKNSTFKANGATKEVLETGVRSKLINSGNYRYFSVELGKSELLGKTIALTRTITNSASNMGQISLFFGNETSQSKKFIFSNRGSGTSNINIPNTFPEDCDRIWVLFYGNVTGTGNVGDYADYTDLMITLGDTLQNYEDYGVMPSPDYPSEVECVKGKNLFDYTKLNDENTIQWKAYEDAGTMFRALPIYVGKNKQVYFSSNVPALTSGNAFYAINNINEMSSNTLNVDNPRVISSNNDGYVYLGVVTNRQYYAEVQNNEYWIMISTDNQPYLPYNTIQVKNTGKNLYKYGDISNTVSNNYFVNHKLLDNFENNTTYTISLDITSTVQPFRISIGYGNDNFQKEMVNGTIPNVNNGHVSFTFTTNDTTYSNLWIRAPRYITPTTYTATVSNIMIEKGTQTTDYEPYQENTLNIDLQGNELCSLPNNVKDELVIENGRAKIIKNVGKVVLNGTENWIQSFNDAYIQISNAKGKNTPTLSNYFKSVSATTDIWGDIKFGKINKNLIFYKGAIDLAGFKTWLSTHNTTVYYELETPTEIDLGEVGTLSTFKGVNNVSLDASMQTNMNLIYIADYEELDKHFLKDVNVSFSKKYGAINSVVFSRGGGSDNIYRKDNASINKNGLTEIKIADNPFLEGDDRENFIQPLFDKINGLEFYLLDVNSTGIMYLELGDLYYFNMVEEKPSLKSGLVKSGMRKAQGSSGGKFLCLLMNDEIKITQGLEESIYSDEPEITETNYKTASITDASIKNAIIQTNKNSAEILLKVNSNKVVSAINLSPENIKISSAKLDVDAIATFTNSKLAEAGSTVINGANITTGSINCDRLNGGTINGQTINGGTIAGTQINATSGNIGGFNIDGSSGFASDYGALRPNGNLLLYPNNASARYVLSNAMTCNAQTGVVIASNCDSNILAPSVNLDLKACSGAKVYLGSMFNADGTDERSGIICSNGVLEFRSTGYCTYNGTSVFGSSSKATKENIEDLSQKQKEEVYELIKNIPTKQYDYKKEYGKPFNYGFIIEDIENTKLKKLLHITQAENNKDIKMYSTEDLVRLELIVIQELMRKIDNLEQKVFILEKERESENNAEN